MRDVNQFRDWLFLPFARKPSAIDMQGGVLPGDTATRPPTCRTRLISTLFAVMLGVLSGVGLFTFGYGKGASYLSDNPVGCANCHVMQSHFDSWQQSSHRHVAVCNDCHLPHTFFGHWLTKADNGFFHSLAFTLDSFPEPIQIKVRNRRVTQSACVDCHAATVHQMMADTNGIAPSCVHCHSDVGHQFHQNTVSQTARPR